MGNPDKLEAMTFGGRGVFGGTYPARIWGQFMQAATSQLPVLDFTPPDQSLWPRPSFLDENGRRGFFFVAPPVFNPPPAPTTPPPSINFGGGPPNTTPVTAPPATTPATTPKKKKHPPKG